MKKICLIVNHTTRAEGFDVGKICDYIKEKGGVCTVLKARKKEEIAMEEGFTDFSDLASDTSALLVLGGDGTIIQAARGVAGTEIPILGINMGTMGFLAEAEVDAIYESIDKIFSENFRLQSHIMLKGSIFRGEKKFYSSVALNDIVIARGRELRVIATEIRIDGNVMSCFLGDGVIVSTPTGSTGYTLSAGGTILMPDTNVFEITPICPHSFQARGVVTSSASKVEISFVKAKKTQSDDGLVSFDGNEGIGVMTGDRIEIERAQETVRFIRFEDFSFLNTLNRKMRKA